MLKGVKNRHGKCFSVNIIMFKGELAMCSFFMSKANFFRFQYNIIELRQKTDLKSSTILKQMYWPCYYPVYNPIMPFYYCEFTVPVAENNNSEQQQQIGQVRETNRAELQRESSLESKEQKFEAIKLTLTKEQLLGAGYEVGRSCWTEQEDEQLLSLTSKSTLNWKEIAEQISGRNQKMCYSRYRRLISSNRRKWKKQQDQLILSLINKYGYNWKKISTHFQSRSPKLLKEHYTNHLAQNVNKEEWTVEEDLMLIKLLNKEGRNWRVISEKMYGRTVTQLKNRYFGRLKRLQQAKNSKQTSKKDQ